MRRSEVYAAVEAAVAEAHERDAGGEVRVLCPFCVSSKTGAPDRSLGVNLTTGKFWCHRCETKGRLPGYADPDEDNPAPRCLQVGSRSDAEKPRIAIPPQYVPLGYGDGAESTRYQAAREYAAERGFSQALATEYEVGACLTGWYYGRLVLPCMDEQRNWWGFVARDYTGRKTEPDGTLREKYLYPRGMPKKENLVHAHVLQTPTDEPALVVEGWLDTVPFLGDAVAVLGKVSDAHFKLFADAMRPVCFVLDGDAWREAEAAVMRLRLSGVRSGFVKLPPKTDPDQVDPAWLRKQARASLR